MSCPDCGKEHPAGKCAASDHEMDYVTVLETTEPQQLSIIESVLQGAGIPFVVEGAEGMGLLPVGFAGTGDRLHGLGARINVPREMADEARALLESVDTGDGSEE